MNFDYSKIVILLRHCSGAGSSTFANLFKLLYSDTEICSADQFFINEKREYKFDKYKLGYVHKKCEEQFENALKNNKKIVIVCNTLVKDKDFQFYINKSKEYHYKLISLVVENRNNTQNIHDCPLETIQKQADLIKNSLKLF